METLDQTTSRAIPEDTKLEKELNTPEVKTDVIPPASRINIKVARDLHMAARVYGIQQGMTLAEVVELALKQFLEAPVEPKAYRQPRHGL